MNTKKKALALLMVMFITVSLIAGCSSAEIALYNATMKNAEMLSYEDNMEAKVSVEISGMSDEDMADIQPILNIINASSITMSQKLITNEDQTMVKGRIDMNLMSIMGDMPFTIWMDIDLSGSDLTFEEIVKLPSQLTAEIPELEGKEYIAIRSNVLDDTLGIDYSGIMESSLEFEADMEDMVAEFMQDWDYSGNYLSNTGRGTLDGETVKIYNLKMNDEEAKDWLNYFMTFIIDEGYFTSFMEGYVGLIEQSMPQLEMGSEDAVEIQEFEEIIKMYSSDETKEEMLEAIDEFFDMIDDVNILDEDGIDITYKIDSEGYLVATEGTIGLSLDVKEFSEAIDEPWTMEEEPEINVVLTFNDRISNINAVEEIEFPELTLDNSLDLYDMMSDTMDEMKVLVNNERVYYDELPRMESGRTLVPLRKTAEAMDMQVTYDDATRTVTASKEGTEIKLTIDQDTVYVNGEAVKIDVPARMINGRTLIPLRFIGENLDSEVQWDAPNNAVWITKMQ